MANTDTICAVATPAGRGGIGVIRVSGPLATTLCRKISGQEPVPRSVQFASFRDEQGRVLDSGLSLFFCAPHSFTGEDVWELHVHGSPIVLDLLLAALVRAGARLALPGEFSERAFLNDKMDLAQAEAVADLIDSRSAAAAQHALRSLQGEFSRHIHALVAQLTELRVHIEAAIDFPDDEVDFLSSGAAAARLLALRAQLAKTLVQARQGALLREGIQVVIAGEPNVGKSTLLNALAGLDAAIVTDTPGTTRDVVRQEIALSGVPVHILDTAGLRDTIDPVEQEGMRRARSAINQADRVLLLMDARQRGDLPTHAVWQELHGNAAARSKLTVLFNKIDLANLQPAAGTIEGVPALYLSAKHQQGLDLLRRHLLDCAGYVAQEEGGFSARRRHLDNLQSADLALATAQSLVADQALELLAEELRRAQDALGMITGRVTADDLLGEIFRSFCIGK